MESKHKARKQWVTSSFDVFENISSNSTRSSHKFPKPEPLLRKTVGHDLWVEKHSPKNKEELAVHKKKVAEIEEWLKSGCCSEKNRQSIILLLSGPAGSGKTSTIQVLCRHLKIEIKEWINQITSNKEDILSDGTIKIYESQIKIFEDFMLRAGKYPTLNIMGMDPFMKRIVLIEDFPNVFNQNAKEFHRILRQFHRMKRFCAVFIVSDNSSLNIKNLFPQKLQEELKIKSISFNPVSMTNMLRILNKVAITEISPPPEKKVFESLAQLVSGDIRMALNTLQFNFSKDYGTKFSSRSVKKTSKTPTTYQVPSGKNLAANEKDTSLFIFHALGKILYCKRALDQPTDEENLPPCLKHTARHPLLSQPEEIINNLTMSSEAIILFLHQNYHNFFSGIENIVNATQYFSDSDIFTSEWVSRHSLEECAALVAVRGLMYSNNSTSGMGWHPIYKPHWFTTKKLIYSRKDDLRQLHQDLMILDSSLITDIVPYHHIMNFSCKSIEMASVFHQLCSFSSNSHRTLEEQLHEQDMISEMESLTQDEPFPMEDLRPASSYPSEILNLDNNEFDIAKEEKARRVRIENVYRTPL